MSVSGNPAPGKKAPARRPSSWERFQTELQEAACRSVEEYDAKIGRLGLFEDAAPLGAQKEAAVLAYHNLARHLKLSLTEDLGNFGPAKDVQEIVKRAREEERLRK